MRVVLAEDSALLREGLVRLLEEAGHEICAAVCDADALTRAVHEVSPDLVITDVRMPPNHRDEGLRAAVQIRNTHPQIGVLVLSQYVEPLYTAELMAGAANGGGVGYVLKDRITRFEDLVDAVSRVLAGEFVIDPTVISAMLSVRGAHDPIGNLSPRETEVLRLMAEGRSNAAIAQELFISQGAVEKHISSLFAKFNLPQTPEDHHRLLAVLRYLHLRPVGGGS
ncbi:response regulator transcription factor [Micrococcales bacterium 31B]|nr:response regulator transcription factor [Micrococcales bacterium 31B]